jgi:transcriptional regulator with XRE-family HTH domain
MLNYCAAYPKRYGMSYRDEAAHAIEHFGERLTAARKHAGLSQERLASLADISPITLSRLETGASTPSFEVLATLAVALETTPNFLLGWGETGEPSKQASDRAMLNRLVLSASTLSPEWLQQLIDLAERANAPKT